jgi:hypothetical protein
MQQHLMQMQPMMAAYYPSNVTTDHIQQVLSSLLFSASRLLLLFLSALSSLFPVSTSAFVCLLIFLFFECFVCL